MHRYGQVVGDAAHPEDLGEGAPDPELLLNSGRLAGFADQHLLIRLFSTGEHELDNGGRRFCSQTSIT
uniref:Uncharacterized protein n=1 Tax=Oryza meridionalis TaxID=40149 RepID=A0A0E0E437_9ORYZ